jgi:6-phosphogluconolactonase (cycloisomerase 2 family)
MMDNSGTAARRTDLRLLGLITSAVMLTACGGSDHSSSDSPPPVPTFAIGGSVTGLASGDQLRLTNNGGDALTLTANGNFSFATRIARNGSYAVAVDSQPAGKTCSLTGNSGSGLAADVSNVSVTCSVDTHTIGGTVAGLGAGTTLTLLQNSADPLAVSSNGSFMFATPVAYNGGYAVTIGSQPVGQTCSVANGTGSGVVVSDVDTVSVTCSANVYSIGGTVTGLANGAQVTLRNNGGDPLVVTANGGFEFATPVAFDGSYLVTVDTEPAGHACAVVNESGSNVTSNISSVQITCLGVSPYAYVLQNAGTISQYSLDASGTLSANTPDSIAAGSFPLAMSIDPANRYAYVANMGGTISAYTIGADGLLTANGSATVGGNPVDVVVDRTGHYVYLANQTNNTIWQFTIGTGGVLTANGSIVLGAGGLLRGMVAHPTADFVYVLNWSGDIEMLSIGADGALASLGTASTLPYSQGIAIDPSGKYVYVANSNDGSVSQLDIGNDGLLTPNSSVASGLLPNFITVDPSGRYVYVVSTNSHDISQYAIGNDGSLSAIAAPVANTHNPGVINVERSGSYAYVANQADGTISQYAIGNDGSLALFNEFTATAGGQSFIVTTR